MIGAFGAVLEFVQTNGGSIRMKRAFAQWLAITLLAVSSLLDILRAALDQFAFEYTGKSRTRGVGQVPNLPYTPASN
jgi:hypothetical protein